MKNYFKGRTGSKSKNLISFCIMIVLVLALPIGLAYAFQKPVKADDVIVEDEGTCVYVSDKTDGAFAVDKAYSVPAADKADSVPAADKADGVPAADREDSAFDAEGTEIKKVRTGHTNQFETQLKGVLKWKSLNTDIATVNKTGKVKGIKPGKTYITVTNGTQTETIHVKVTPRVIVIDAGHQSCGNSELEPIGPGASEKKAKVSSGTQGCATGLPEYILNLKVAKKLEKALKKEGYRVIMTRTSNDVDISNSQRAKIANKAKADVFIRIHANSSTDSSINGVLTISPTANNPYCASIYKESYALSKSVVDEVSKAAGAKNTGVWQTDSMSGINWCKVPVTILEMGYMSNPAEDRELSKSSYQNKIVKGTVEGIKKYLKSK